jgi:F-type H+-transporting ATPase subunit b
MAEVKASSEVPGHHPAEPTALGFDAPGWIALAMVFVFAVAIWKRVPALVGKLLDNRIALIRAQLDNAEQLRKEAEALKAEYEAKSAAADAEAAAMVARAQEEAKGIVDKARKDSAALIERRGKLAEDKIAAAERSAIAEVRAKAADAAARAAAAIIADKHGADSDKALVDKTIAGLSRVN